MMELYAALDEPNADVDLILGQIADWYEERGDCFRAECLQWCRAEGKRPARIGTSWGWWGSHRNDDNASIGRRMFCFHGTHFVYSTMGPCFQRLEDVWHALRTRGEEPVAGIDSERMVTT